MQRIVDTVIRFNKRHFFQRFNCKVMVKQQIRQKLVDNIYSHNLMEDNCNKKSSDISD